MHIVSVNNHWIPLVLQGVDQVIKNCTMTNRLDGKVLEFTQPIIIVKAVVPCTNCVWIDHLHVLQLACLNL